MPSPGDNPEDLFSKSTAWPPPPSRHRELHDLPDIQIFPRPPRVARMLFGGIFLVVAGAFDAWIGLTAHSIILTVAGVVGVVFFGLCIAAIIALSFRRQPLIEITQSGIVDHSSAIGAGLIGWDEILATQIHSIMGSKYLVLYVSYPDEVIRRQSPIKRMLMRANRPIVGSPVAIAATLLPMPIEQLQAHILDRMGQRGVGDNRPNV